MDLRSRRALIFGASGQDGIHLARLLLGKGYEVFGASRRLSAGRELVSRVITAERTDLRPHLHLTSGDVTDAMGVEKLIRESQPHEIYNLAAQSDVGESYLRPMETVKINAEGVVTILESMRFVDGDSGRLYHASSSELFGSGVDVPQSETTPFNPRNPYAISKHLGHMMVAHYRETYGVHASNGIMYNHEGPFRGENFVTRKISTAVAKCHLGHGGVLELGDLGARRDWGHVDDYVVGMWQMLQQEEPDDYVFATGKSRTVRDFVETAFGVIERSIVWEGVGADEIGRDDKTGAALICVNKNLFRPNSDVNLVGDASKARKKLGWYPKRKFAELVSEMVESDINALSQ